MSNSVNVNFTPLPMVDLVADKTAVQADGVSSVKLTATVHDANGSPLPGHLVNLNATGSAGYSHPTPSTGVSDANGNVTWTAWDSQVELVTFSVNVVN